MHEIIPLPDPDNPYADPAPPPSVQSSLPPSGQDGVFVSSLLAMVMVALLGGLVLNVMPCVLPVLSLKMLGIVKHGGGNAREVRLSFFATALGVVFFFLLLAGLTIAARDAGKVVGWGFHFQSPVFLSVLVVLIVLFSANMLGWFEIRLPALLNTHIYEASGHTSIKRHHLLGDFVTGLFAALMATPCSAPFLGTAVGFALSRGTKEIFAIFMALGFGLASPYLLAALMPHLAARLPKPGIWMLRVKQVMGVLLLASAVWLGWVLWQEITTKPHMIDASSIWQPFDKSRIIPLVASGKTVFVDVTADWCLTCKFNALRVLNRDDVHAMLSSKNVVAMKADMTKPMPDIQAYLRENGRYGIPFNIVYSPAHPKGIILPELLTVDSVKQELLMELKNE